MTHTFVLLLITVILILGQSSVFLSPILGVYVNAGLIILFLLLATYDIYDLYAEDVFTLSAAIPTITVIILALQITNPLLNSFIVYAALLIITIGYISLLYIKHDIFRLRLKHIRSIPVGIFIGGLLGIGIVYLFNSSFPRIEISLSIALFFILLRSLAESFFFQALVQNAVTLMTESVLGIVFTAFLYTIFHASHNYLFTGIFFLMSIITSTFYYFSKNIYAVVLFNIFLNLTFFLLSHSLLTLALR